MDIKKIKKICTLEYWHIGLIDKSLNEIVEGKDITNDIKWFRYNYYDRFFADPFILKNEGNSISCLAEEYTFYDRKGRIVELTFNLETMRCTNRKVLIDENTHLSFPFIYEGNVYPESFRSGSYYKYSYNNGFLNKEKVANIPAIDPILFQYEGVTYLFCSYRKEALDKLRLFYKDNNVWVEHPMSPIVDNIECARMAGDFFYIGKKLYRPAQDCGVRYGESIRLMEVKKLSKSLYKEEEICHITTHSCKHYNMGLHTFNCKQDKIIIDGYEHRFRPLLRIWIAIKRRFFLSSTVARIEKGKPPIMRKDL